SGMLPCKPVAECTTTIGRGMIDDSKRFAENIENFRDIMQYKDAFPDTYYYLFTLVNETKPKPKFDLGTIKKVVGMFACNLPDLSRYQKDASMKQLSLWELVHAHFK